MNLAGTWLRNPSYRSDSAGTAAAMRRPPGVRLTTGPDTSPDGPPQPLLVARLLRRHWILMIRGVPRSRIFRLGVTARTVT